AAEAEAETATRKRMKILFIVVMSERERNFGDDAFEFRVAPRGHAVVDDVAGRKAAILLIDPLRFHEHVLREPESSADLNAPDFSIRIDVVQLHRLRAAVARRRVERGAEIELRFGGVVL